MQKPTVGTLKVVLQSGIKEEILGRVPYEKKAIAKKTKRYRIETLPKETSIYMKILV